jgi:hypothetical protein
MRLILFHVCFEWEESSPGRQGDSWWAIPVWRWNRRARHLSGKKISLIYGLFLVFFWFPRTGRRGDKNSPSFLLLLAFNDWTGEGWGLLRVVKSKKFMFRLGLHFSTDFIRSLYRVTSTSAHNGDNPWCPFQKIAFTTSFRLFNLYSTRITEPFYLFYRKKSRDRDSFGLLLCSRRESRAITWEHITQRSGPDVSKTIYEAHNAEELVSIEGATTGHAFHLAHLVPPHTIKIPPSINVPYNL